MKKLFAIILCVALAAVAVACVANAVPGGSVPPAEPSTLPATPEDGAPVVGGDPALDANAGMPSPTVQEDKLTVADAFLYRGNVIKSELKDGKLVVTLQQATGTNFGAPTLTFGISDDSRISFPAEQLASLDGKYIEVYYSYMTKNAPNPDEVYDAIAVNSYGEEGMVNFNGTVTEIVPDADKPGEGRLLMTGDDGNDFQVYFLYSGETQFYMNFDDIKVGDKLNIFHSPAMAMSMPPQCSAYEIRPFHNAEV